MGVSISGDFGHLSQGQGHSSFQQVLWVSLQTPEPKVTTAEACFTAGTAFITTHNLQEIQN